MHGGGRGPSTPCVGEQLGRRAAVRGQAGLVLGPLLGQVHVQRRARRSRAGDGRRAASAGTARTEWIAAPTPRVRRRRSSASTRSAQRVDVAVAEPQLRPGQRLHRPPWTVR